MKPLAGNPDPPPQRPVPMRILMLSWNFPPAMGGMEFMIDNIFRGLRRRGHAVSMVTARAEGAPPEPDVFRSPWPRLGGFVAYSFLQGRKLARAAAPDAILCGSLVTAPAAWWLSRRFHVPFVVLVHGGDIAHGGRLYQAVARRLLAAATRVCANSHYTRDLLVSKGVAAARIDVVHPGVAVERFEPPLPAEMDALRARYGERRILLSVGRLVRRKGILEFVDQVMPELVRRYPDLLLLVVGEDARDSLLHKGEGMRAQIDARIRERNLSDHVKLLGALPDAALIPLYFRAEIFLLPCLDIPGDVEGFGIVFSEAALARTPIVATRAGGIPDAVAEGETGLLVPPGDYPAMATALARLLDDPDGRRRMGQAARERARRCFDWPVIMQQYEATLQQARAQLKETLQP